jgi:MraZ protein
MRADDVLLTGQQATTLDSKGRLAIPARYRALLEEGCEGRLKVTVNHDRECLLIYPIQEYDQRAQVINKLSDFDPLERRLKLMFIGHAFDMDMDANARVLVPSTLRELVGIEREVVLVGQHHKLELWDAAAWTRKLDSLFSIGPAVGVSEKLRSLSL